MTPIGLQPATAYRGPKTKGHYGPPASPSQTGAAAMHARARQQDTPQAPWPYLFPRPWEATPSGRQTQRGMAPSARSSRSSRRQCECTKNAQAAAQTTGPVVTKACMRATKLRHIAAVFIRHPLLAAGRVCRARPAGRQTHACAGAARATNCGKLVNIHFMRGSCHANKQQPPLQGSDGSAAPVLILLRCSYHCIQICPPARQRSFVYKKTRNVT